ncbi:MAG: site-2 protease family protein [Actinomycetota bacterium]|nr:site-2 protease family protein [Actinomycetota bacterium]
MFPTISLGRIAGIRVGLDVSLLLVLALIAWSLESMVFPAQDPHLRKSAYVAMGIVAAILYLVCVLLHELGHSLQARREGVGIDGITLWLFGGVSRFRGTFRSPGSEFRVAIAGPLVSLVLGGLFVGIAQLVRSPVEVEGVAAWLGYINLILFVFNMLPALPLDGGRVFHAVLWRIRGSFPWATRVAADVGRGFGYLLIVGGLALGVTRGAWGGLWLAFVGWFLVQAARAEGQLASRMPA